MYLPYLMQFYGDWNKKHTYISFSVFISYWHSDSLPVSIFFSKSAKLKYTRKYSFVTLDTKCQNLHLQKKNSNKELYGVFTSGFKVIKLSLYSDPEYILYWVWVWSLSVCSNCFIIIWSDQATSSSIPLHLEWRCTNVYAI